MLSIKNTGVTNLFGPEELKIVYNSLNGKGNTIASGREITKEHIRRALSRAFDMDSGRIIRELQEGEEKKDFTNEEKYGIRYAVINLLQKRFNVTIVFDEAISNLKRGSRVKINRDSQYAHQCSGEGTLQFDFEDSDEEGYVPVDFDNGYSNTYRKRDLVPVGKIDTKKAEAIYASIGKEDDAAFIKRIAEEIYPQIKKNSSESQKNSSEAMGFCKGVDIEMNRGANDQYSFTKAGSRGKIIKVGKNRNHLVEFSYFSVPGHSVPHAYKVHEDYMTLLRPWTLEALSAMIHTTLIENIASAITQKEKKKYEEKYETLGLEKLLTEGMFLPVDSKHYALNFGEVTKFVAPKLHAMYSDPNLYSSAVMFEPPSERQPNVLRLQLTEGCDHNKCTYCNGFNGVKHCQKTKEQFIQHTDKVLDSLDGYKGEINRVFIGSGNGLDVDQDTLKACVQYVNKRLNLKRIAIYANTRSILSKTGRELRALRESGLSCIYRGAETGSDGVLQYVNKGCTFKEMLTAGEMINDANMDLSVMLMPGLGGLRYSEEHVKGIIKLLNSVRFKFITLMAINPPKESKYERIMSKEIVEGTNRPLTNVEIVEQIREIVKNTYTNGQKIGMFGKEIDIVGSNPINFSVQLYDEGKREILRTCDKYIKENKIPSKHIER